MGRLDFLYRMDLPHRAVSVYIYLYDRANKDGECWPAIPTIAKELKLSQSTVRRALKDLRKAVLITTEQRYREKGGRAVCFTKCKKDKKKKHLPPRKDYAFSAVGATCHDGRRK